MRPDNPFSRFLRREAPRDPDRHDWIDRWDQAEQLIIQVYKAGRSDLESDATWRALRAELLKDLVPLSADLDKHWPRVVSGGETLQADPFQTLLSHSALDGFVENWPAMQVLPAAREVLNLWLISADSQR